VKPPGWLSSAFAAKTTGGSEPPSLTRRRGGRCPHTSDYSALPEGVRPSGQEDFVGGADACGLYFEARATRTLHRIPVLGDTPSAQGPPELAQAAVALPVASGRVRRGCGRSPPKNEAIGGPGGVVSGRVGLARLDPEQAELDMPSRAANRGFFSKLARSNLLHAPGLRPAPNNRPSKQNRAWRNHGTVPMRIMVWRAPCKKRRFGIARNQRAVAPPPPPPERPVAAGEGVLATEELVRQTCREQIYEAPGECADAGPRHSPLASRKIPFPLSRPKSREMFAILSATPAALFDTA